MKNLAFCLSIALFNLAGCKVKPSSQVAASSPSDAAPTAHETNNYPVVLVHGMFGFNSLMNSIDYWYGIPQALEADGAQVFVARVASLQSTEVRGEELLRQVEEIVATTGSPKVHLWGHSHGAPTSRYVAAVKPDLVASVTSLAGANKGSPLGTVGLEMFPEGTLFHNIIVGLMNTMANVLTKLDSSKPDAPNDALASVKALTIEGARIFNEKFPDAVPLDECGDGETKVNGIYYFSFTGDKARSNHQDMTDMVFDFSSRFFNGRPNDGMLANCDTHLGKTVKDDLPMNHLDIVNNLFGLVQVDPVPLYVRHYRILKTLDSGQSEAMSEALGDRLTADYQSGASQRRSLTCLHDLDDEAECLDAYKIISGHSQKCLNLDIASLDQGRDAGFNILQYSCPHRVSEWRNSYWKLVPDSEGRFLLRSEHSGLCIGSDGASGNGTNVSQLECDPSSSSQIWRIEWTNDQDYGRVIQDGSEMCLSVDTSQGGYRDHANVHLWGCDPQMVRSQKWNFMVVR